MPIEFRCGECGNLLRTPDGSGGKTGQCPSCNATMKIPESSPTTDSNPGSTNTESPFGALPSGDASQSKGGDRWKSSPEPSEPVPQASEGVSANQPEQEPDSPAPQQPVPDYYTPASPNPYGHATSHPSAQPYRPRFAGKPHRAPVVFTLGLLGLLLSFVGCCPSICTAPFTFVGGILGLIAVILGNSDRKEIEAGTMDPEGRDLTQIGYWLGVICCAVFVLKVLVFIGVVVFYVIAAIANNA